MLIVCLCSASLSSVKNLNHNKKNHFIYTKDVINAFCVASVSHCTIAFL